VGTVAPNPSRTDPKSETLMSFEPNWGREGGRLESSNNRCHIIITIYSYTVINSSHGILSRSEKNDACQETNFWQHKFYVESKNPPFLSDIFSQTGGNFLGPNFTRLFYVPIYAGVQFFKLITCNFDEVMPY